MTALSIVLPEELAQKSAFVAKKMHITRSQFIRLAIENELKTYRLMMEQQAMVAGFSALKQQTSYLNEITDLEQLDVTLNDEGEWWWKE